MICAYGSSGKEIKMWYMMFCGVVLGIVSGANGIFLMKEPIKFITLNWIPLMMIIFAPRFMK